MKKREIILSAPSLLWLGFFFIIPTVFVLINSFRGTDSYGILTREWTLEAYRSLSGTNLFPIILRTLRLSLYTTILCLLIATPSAYAMARMSRRAQNTFLMLLIIPFWTNFLIRIYAWKVLLHPEGFIKQFLVLLGLVDQGSSLLYTEGAVLLVLIYTYLPFALLPLYSAAEKFDFTLLDAARDLGANTFQLVLRVFLPGIRGGIISAVLVVFIPALGSYIIPEIVGGTNSEMLGNKIAQYVFIDRNIPRAGALSGFLILIILLPSLASLLKRDSVGSGRQGLVEA
ncbi:MULTISPECIES: ABC transporter permease [unclassified Oceanispirochaeta]|uniref:ABC transporter permease n=1 Tax=unclassified Oceanispirochaeta TaxID=2635722 RepID=UPI000E08EF3D|nr:MULTISPECIES: ABC transporter permease [unclassified Oceanispirochaeta]MBF9016323.1 ABC transporter permease [Oceanispirochaeta sp. M2]NPD72786.1 ABC transporter permease [Oceanispirochaeta sp. M1]RDG31630.1 ABC transporter permease [Oceanispirochaeta sp. M1]